MTSTSPKRQILELYDQLVSVAPSPVVALNRAVAVAEVAGPALALGEVDELAVDLGDYHVFHVVHVVHVVRADLLRRLGRLAEAGQAYDAAMECTENAAERAFLEHARQALAADAPG